MWRTTDTDKGVAWADVNGDLWADLALGHSPTQLWGNDEGAFSVVWSSAATYFGHSDIAFCDVDRDGDPDLAEDHFSNGQVHIYLNDGGVLASAPSWTYDSPTVGTALAFGDINGDQWPDLVVGNSGEPCVKVFYAVPPETAAPDDGRAAAAPVLHVSYPNPFNPRTTVAFELPHAGSARVRLYDIHGILAATLLEGSLSAGRHEVIWTGIDDSGRPLPSGVYFLQLEYGGSRLTRKLALAR